MPDLAGTGKKLPSAAAATHLPGNGRDQEAARGATQPMSWSGVASKGIVNKAHSGGGQKAVEVAAGHDGGSGGKSAIINTLVPSEGDVMLQGATDVREATHTAPNSGFTVFEKKDTVAVTMMDVNSSRCVPATKTQTGDVTVTPKVDRIVTDAELAALVGRRPSEQRQAELTPWESDPDVVSNVHAAAGLGDLSTNWSPQAMFKNHDRNFKKSDFKSDLSQYTIQLEKQNTPEYRQMERNAERIANEINQKSGANGRRAGSDTEDFEDEETKFSAVTGPQDARYSSSSKAALNGDWRNPANRTPQHTPEQQLNRAAGGGGDQRRSSNPPRPNNSQQLPYRDNHRNLQRNTSSGSGGGGGGPSNQDVRGAGYRDGGHSPNNWKRDSQDRSSPPVSQQQQSNARAPLLPNPPGLPISPSGGGATRQPSPPVFAPAAGPTAPTAVAPSPNVPQPAPNVQSFKQDYKKLTPGHDTTSRKPGPASEPTSARGGVGAFKPPYQKQASQEPKRPPSERSGSERSSRGDQLNNQGSGSAQTLGRPSPEIEASTTPVQPHSSPPARQEQQPSSARQPPDVNAWSKPPHIRAEGSQPQQQPQTRNISPNQPVVQHTVTYHNQQQRLGGFQGGHDNSRQSRPNPNDFPKQNIQGGGNGGGNGGGQHYNRDNRPPQQQQQQQQQRVDGQYRNNRSKESSPTLTDPDGRATKASPRPQSVDTGSGARSEERIESGPKLSKLNPEAKEFTPMLQRPNQSQESVSPALDHASVEPFRGPNIQRTASFPPSSGPAPPHFHQPQMQHQQPMQHHQQQQQQHQQQQLQMQHHQHQQNQSLSPSAAVVQRPEFPPQGFMSVPMPPAFPNYAFQQQQMYQQQQLQQQQPAHPNFSPSSPVIMPNMPRGQVPPYGSQTQIYPMNPQAQPMMYAQAPPPQQGYMQPPMMPGQPEYPIMPPAFVPQMLGPGVPPGQLLWAGNVPPGGPYQAASSPQGMMYVPGNQYTAMGMAHPQMGQMVPMPYGMNIQQAQAFMQQHHQQQQQQHQQQQQQLQPQNGNHNPAAFMQHHQQQQQQQQHLRPPGNGN
ncbi:hypothetical protein BV898_14489 [Hypsibius exemplaris]|uniref:LsmAD domain-containing protein n=1 Tax=Hypsibius exemplaris TaxID=2072580 RepID=A0A9X6RJG6_HYPEX|nr:hypothetical protein BV898_14489 [Hypsibius exemplaris]